MLNAEPTEIEAAMARSIRAALETCGVGESACAGGCPRTPRYKGGARSLSAVDLASSQWAVQENSRRVV